MDLKKFIEAEDCDVMKVDQMVVNRKYPIIRAKRVNTKFGETILLTTKDYSEQLVKVFLSNRYSSLFTDEDIESINSKRVQLNLIYKATCLNKKSHKLGNRITIVTHIYLIF